MGPDRHEAAVFGEGLREREALLTEAERIVHLGCWMWDTKTGAIRWSDELFRIFGHEPRSLVPTPETFFKGIHPDDVERVQRVAGAGVETGRPEPVDFRVVRPDGTVRNVHMDAAVVKREESLCFVGTVLDVTDRLVMENRLRHAQKLEAVGTLAGGVAHDFNNYLHVILGSVSLLAEHDLPRDETLQILAQVREAAEASQRLTQQLLLFSRKGASTPELLSLEQLLDRSMPLYQSLLGDGIRLRRVQCRGEVRVHCNRAAFEQVVLNLLINARDAMPGPGRVTLEVETVSVLTARGALRPGSYAVVSVEDEGSGIPPEILPRIFEPFFTTREHGKGTGLGLATVHGIVEQAGGAIEVESMVGRGTTMRVFLPLADGQREPPPPPASAPRPRSPHGRVLVVEDQPLLRSVIRRQLEIEGYEVCDAEHGLDALRVLAERADIDLVLSDVSMPTMTGAELARRLGVERPELPLVLMGGRGDSDIRGLAVPFLPKPFTTEDLLRILGSVRRPPKL